MWQTNYASVVPKNLGVGVGVNFRLCSKQDFYLQFLCHCLRKRSVQNNPLCALPTLKNGYHFQVIFQKVDEHMGSRSLLGYLNIMWAQYLNRGGIKQKIGRKKILTLKAIKVLVFFINFSSIKSQNANSLTINKKVQLGLVIPRNFWFSGFLRYSFFFYQQ